MSALPSSWAAAGLLEVSELVRGVTYSKADASDVEFEDSTPVLRASNLQGREFDLENLVHVPRGVVSNTQLVKKGDVVIATSSGSISVVGKAVQARSDMLVGFGAFCGLLRPDADFDHRYFGHFFSSDQYRSRVSEMARGVNINNLKREHFASLTLSLPPLAEQERIADKLDALLDRIDACRERLDLVPALLRRFRESVLSAAMTGQLTEDWRGHHQGNCSRLAHDIASDRAKKWKTRGKYKPAMTAEDVQTSEFGSLPAAWHRGTLDEITWSVKDGPHFSPKYQSAGIPFISGGSIKPGKIDLSNSKFISSELHAELSSRCQPEYLDVFYTKGGTTGVAAVNTLKDPVNVWVHVAVLKLVSARLISPFFVQHALNSPSCYQQSQRFTHGVGNQDLGLTRMIKIVLPVPPIEEQTEIVVRVDALFALADRIENRYRTARAQVDKITPALLAKAFRGELVPQDPNDEAASVLLDRIRARRARTSEKSLRGPSTARKQHA